jgi:DUF971 family protein
MIQPKKINLKNQENLNILWDDETEYSFPLKLLRDESPDATNKGETILWKHYPPSKQDPDKSGKYKIEKIERVGNYAVRITWGDGNAFGIYSWSYFHYLYELTKEEN